MFAVDPESLRVVGEKTGRAYWYWTGGYNVFAGWHCARAIASVKKNGHA